MKKLDNLDVLTLLTLSLLENGIDYEVELKGSKVTVQLFDEISNTSLGCALGSTLEEALARVLGQVVGKCKSTNDRLSIL